MPITRGAGLFTWGSDCFNMRNSELSLMSFRIRSSPIALIPFNSLNRLRFKRIVLRECGRQRERSLSVKILVGQAGSSQKKRLAWMRSCTFIPNTSSSFNVLIYRLWIRCEIVLQWGQDALDFFPWQTNWYILSRWFTSTISSPGKKLVQHEESLQSFLWTNSLRWDSSKVRKNHFDSVDYKWSSVYP